MKVTSKADRANIIRARKIVKSAGYKANHHGYAQYLAGKTKEDVAKLYAMSATELATKIRAHKIEAQPKTPQKRKYVKKGWSVETVRDKQHYQRGFIAAMKQFNII